MTEPRADKNYTQADWQDHYEKNDLGWDLGRASPPLARWIEENSIAPCRVIVPGCGRGHEVLHLAEKGFEVTAVDFTAGAVDHVSRALAERGLRGTPMQRNFFDLESQYDGAFDLMLEQTFFCAISPRERPAYVNTACRILKPGACLLGLFYQTNESGGPPFNTTRDDILHHFSPRFEIEHLEKTPHSVDRRKDREWLGYFRKK